MLVLKGAGKGHVYQGENGHRIHRHGLSMSTALALLAVGANLGIRIWPRKVPVIHMASKRLHVESLRAVIEHGADVDAVNPFSMYASPLKKNVSRIVPKLSRHLRDANW